MILRGNHKSAKETLNSEYLEKAMGKEVEHGWALILFIDLVHHIRNVGVVPLGVSEEFSVNENGDHYMNRRVTND